MSTKPIFTYKMLRDNAPPLVGSHVLINGTEVTIKGVCQIEGQWVLTYVYNGGDIDCIYYNRDNGDVLPLKSEEELLIQKVADCIEGDWVYIDSIGSEELAKRIIEIVKAGV